MREKPSRASAKSLACFLREKKVPYFNKHDWLRIDEAEIALGKLAGKSREKLDYSQISQICDKPAISMMDH